MLRVLIADDHAIVRKGLKQILREQPEPTEVGEAGDGTSAMEMIADGEWDVAVLDISMPGMNGLQVLRQVRRSRPELPVLMLSMHSAPMYIQQSLKLGAAGYLSKESAPEELIAAIEAARGGDIYVSRELKKELEQNPARGTWGSRRMTFMTKPN